MPRAPAYDTDLKQALAAISEVLQNHPRTLKDPVPVIAVSVLAHFSIKIAVKPWVSVPDYVSAGGEIKKTIVETFRKGFNAVLEDPEMRAQAAKQQLELSNSMTGQEIHDMIDRLYQVPADVIAKAAAATGEANN